MRQRLAQGVRQPWVLCSILFVAMMFFAVYFVGRFSGLWAETDSTEFTGFLRTMSATGQLLPADADIYPNGYAAQSIGTFLVATTGLDIQSLQQIWYPLLAALVVLPAWATYRELTGSMRGAAIATALLITQPEFLFVVLRSSHEKFTRVLMLLCLMLLMRSFRLYRQPGQLSVTIALFYLATFTFVTSNNLLAHSFIVALASALGLTLLLQRWQRFPDAEQKLARRFGYATLISLGLVYVFTFYAYPPARANLMLMQSFGDKVSALFLDVQAQPTNAYAQVSGGWVSLPIYFGVSLANWLLLVSSAAICGWRWLRWLQGRHIPATANERIVLLLYTAFAIQGAISVVVDASGALGSNLQHRLFPSVSILAAALVGYELSQIRPSRIGRFAQVGAAVGIACLALFSMLKATNEPALSNKWTFYRESEIAAMDWADSHQNTAVLWTEFDERLTLAWKTERGESANNNDFRGFALRPSARDVLVTSVTALRGARLGQALPVPADALRVYDNGEAELYHLRPLTPYQR